MLRSLKTGGASLDKFRLLLLGVAISGVWKLILATGIINRPGVLMAEELNISMGFIPDYFAPVLYLSLMNLAAGLLSGRGWRAILCGWCIGLVDHFSNGCTTRMD